MNTLKRAALLLALSNFLAIFSSTGLVRAASGDLDPSFGTGGKVVRSFSPQHDWIEDMVLQTDGKIVAVGRIGFEPYIASSFGVVRFNADGSLDTSFGSGGWVTTLFNTPFAWAEGVAVQPDGKIIVCGTISSLTGQSWYGLTRYLPDGTLDPTFSDDGKLELAGSGAYALDLQPDGKILAAGSETAHIEFVRFLSNGILDKRFGHVGKQTFFAGVQSYARVIRVQQDGKIIVAGHTQIGSSFYCLIVRFNKNGRLDTTFAEGGSLITSFDKGAGQIMDLDIQTDNKIVVAGMTDPASTGRKVGVIRFNPDGTLDTTFDEDGKVTTDISAFGDAAYAVRVQPDGKIIAAGYTVKLANQDEADFLVVRYNSNGSLDKTFGEGGISEVSTSNAGEEVTVLALQSDGKIVAGGGAEGARGKIDFALVRLMGN